MSDRQNSPNIATGTTIEIAPGVMQTTLDNGVRVISDKMTRVATASVGIWVDCGSRAESANMNGAAHLIEHMVFKGTQSRSAEQIAREVEDVGGQINAWTAREQTGFYVRMLADDVPLGMDILSDLLTNPAIDQEELDRERNVVIQEIGMVEDTPDDIIFDHFQQCAFPDQGMGRPILGTRDTVSSMTRHDLRDFLSHHYAANRMVVSGAGAIDHQHLVDLAQKSLGHLHKSDVQPAAPAQYQGGEVRVEDDLEQLHWVLGFPGLDHHDPMLYPLQAFSTILGGGMSSRLFQEIREKRGLVYSIYSYLNPFADSGIFGIYAGTDPDRIAELVPVVCDQLVSIADTVTEDEVRRAKAQLRAGVLMSLESSMARAEFWASNVMIFGAPPTVDTILARIDAIDLPTIQAAAHRVLSGAPTMAAMGRLTALESLDQIRMRLVGLRGH